LVIRRCAPYLLAVACSPSPPPAAVPAKVQPTAVSSAPAAPETSAAPPPSAADDGPEAARGFLLRLLDAARRGDSAVWNDLQSEGIRRRGPEGPLGPLRMQGWANDLSKLEQGIREGRVFAKESGNRTVIMVEPKGEEARAVAFVTFERGSFRLDEN